MYVVETLGLILGRGEVKSNGVARRLAHLYTWYRSINA